MMLSRFDPDSTSKILIWLLKIMSFSFFLTKLEHFHQLSHKKCQFGWIPTQILLDLDSNTNSNLVAQNHVIFFLSYKVRAFSSVFS